MLKKIIFALKSKQLTFLQKRRMQKLIMNNMNVQEIKDSKIFIVIDWQWIFEL